MTAALRNIAVGFFALAACSAHAEPAPFMMRATVDGRTIEGQPLAWDADEIFLLGRDGALHEFKSADAKDSKKTAKAYTGYSAGEMQALARAEFGQRFDISISTHFVVVRPRGQGGEWVRRLETLYSGFTTYMSIRGFRIADPPTHLLAIVFPSRDEYYAHAAKAGTTLGEGTLGHYDGQSNRFYMYDIKSEGGDEAGNIETIIHEATHQTAYNVGVHARFAEQPRWLVEGLAMMFEAPGVWSSTTLHDQADRINRYRLDEFRSGAESREANWLPQLVAGDEPFKSNVFDAYAQAWTLAFYLCETRPQEFSAYMARVAKRKPFTAYPPAERLNDFQAVFGSDFKLLGAHLQRFVDGLP
jgi:hypothetical protein